MYNVGDIRTNSKGISFECISKSRVSPTLITDKEEYSYVWKAIIGGAGTGSDAPGTTIVLEDEEGNSVVAVLTDEEVDFTATPNDIREGMVAATDEGVTVGEKFIPSYFTSEGFIIIMPDKEFYIQPADHDLYDYTKLQALVCPFNTTIANSVSCEKVVIDNNLYEVLSTTSIGELERNHDNKTVELGIVNTTTVPYLVRYFTYKEVI